MAKARLCPNRQKAKGVGHNTHDTRALRTFLLAAMVGSGGGGWWWFAVGVRVCRGREERREKTDEACRGAAQEGCVVAMQV